MGAGIFFIEIVILAAFVPARQLWEWSGKSTKRPGMKGKAKKEFYRSIIRGKEHISVSHCKPSTLGAERFRQVTHYTLPTQILLKKLRYSLEIWTITEGDSSAWNNSDCLNLKVFRFHVVIVKKNTTLVAHHILNKDCSILFIVMYLICLGNLFI